MKKTRYSQSNRLNVLIGATVMVMGVCAPSAHADIVKPLPALSITTPQILSASIGIGYDFNKENHIDNTLRHRGGHKTYRMIFMQLEPGLGGVKAHLGYGMLSVGCVGYAGLAVKASILRTYWSPVGAEENKTYLGGEIQMTGLIFRLNGGLYRNRSTSDGRDWLLSAGIGLGF